MAGRAELPDVPGYASAPGGPVRVPHCETQVRRLFETDLDAILRFHHVDTVIVTGTATNACCESTARSAFMRDYKVVFPSDANATFDEAMHRATLANIDLLFGRVMTTDELLSEIGVRTAAAD